MSSLGTTMNEKVIPVIMKFVGLKGIVALKDGILFTLPIIMVGSVFLLLAQIPYAPFNDWMASMLGAGWTEPLFQAYNSSFAIIAMIAVVGIAYTYAQNEGHEPLSAGFIALVVFLLTMNSFVVTKSGETVSGVINKDFIGGKGMVTAIIIGLIVGAIYSWFMARKITIKMPACFNINEPVTFGTPIVMNPFMAIPFIITPMVTSLLTYLSIASGLVPLFTGVMVPWTTPPVISGLILGGPRMALLQIVIMAISFFIYLPFFKKQDAINVKTEQEAAQNA